MVTTYVNAEIIILMKGCHGQRAVYVSLSYGLREANQHINSASSGISSNNFSAASKLDQTGRGQTSGGQTSGIGLREAIDF